VALQPGIEGSDVLRELAVGVGERIVEALAEDRVEAGSSGQMLRKGEEGVEAAACGRVGIRWGESERCSEAPCAS
jgi:hypothetical protein